MQNLTATHIKLKTLFLSLSSVFLILLFTATKCKKDPPVYTGPTTAIGVVIDATTNLPVKGATVTIIKHENGQFGGLGDKVETKMVTDSSGGFSYSFEPENGFSYYIDIDAKYYGHVSAEYSIKNHEKNENLRLNISPNGYIRIYLINELPKDTAQSIYVNITKKTVYDIYRDTVLYGEYFGNKSNTFSWWIIKHNITNKYSATIYLKAFDTTDFTIKY
ncbi:MAG: hypothetical protein NTX03_06770 [Bacteroidetes bacterium]|nr:hypothetical protein [Bacteroidota bacterium]